MARNAIRDIYDRFAQEEDPAAFAMRDVDPQTNAILQAIAAQPVATSEQEAYANLAPAAQATERLPMGSFRNNTTGRVQYFGPQGPRDTPYSGDEQAAQAQQQQQPMRLAGYGGGIISDLGTTNEKPPEMDYSRPGAEFAGLGKGYYGKDGNAYIKSPNGLTKVVIGYDRDAAYQEARRDFERRKGEADLTQAAAQTAHTLQSTSASQEAVEAARAQRNVREDPYSQAVLEKRLGKAGDGMRWKTDGSGVEPIPGGQKNADADSVIGLLNMAEPLLDKSTGSTIGAGVDVLARAFGHSTPGANAAGSLKAIEGALISKMPKMSGPQSDKDVAMYRQMAGEIGDATVPADRKRAAMATIRQINATYATPGLQSPPGAPAAPAAPRSYPMPNAAAVSALKNNAGLKADFDAKFGPGSAARYGVR